MNLLFFTILNGFIFLLLVFLDIKSIDIQVSSLFFDKETGWIGHRYTLEAFFYKLGVLPGLLLAVSAAWIILFKKENNTTAKLVLFTFLIGPGLFVNGLLKVWNERPRPRQIIEFNGSDNYQYPLSKWQFSPGKQSFPSGHTSIAFFTALTGLLFFKRYALQIFLSGIIFGLLMGVARVSVGGHFLTDILGAFFFTLLPCFMLKPKKSLLDKL